MRRPTSKDIKNFKDLEEKLALKSPLYVNLRDKYRSPEGYVSWNKTLIGFAAFGEPEYVDIIKKSSRQDAGSPICAGMGARVAAHLDAPAVYLTPELTEALARTDTSVKEPPELVLPCFFVCLPKGVIYTPQGNSVTSVLVYTAETVKDIMPDYMDHIRKSQIHETIKKNRNNLYVAARGGNDLFTSITGWDYRDGDNLDAQSTATITAVERIIKNVILIYNYQKNLITTVKPAATGTGFGQKREHVGRSPLPTTLLGQNFLVRRPNTASQVDGAATTTKRPHWRKGHWHTTVCGTGRTERRLKWFQPVYVNSSLDA